MWHQPRGPPSSKASTHVAVAELHSAAQRAAVGLKRLGTKEGDTASLQGDGKKSPSGKGRTALTATGSQGLMRDSIETGRKLSSLPSANFKKKFFLLFLSCSSSGKPIWHWWHQKAARVPGSQVGTVSLGLCPRNMLSRGMGPRGWLQDTAPGWREKCSLQGTSPQWHS